MTLQSALGPDTLTRACQCVTGPWRPGLTAAAVNPGLQSARCPRWRAPTSSSEKMLCWDLKFRVQGSGFRVQGSGFRV